MSDYLRRTLNLRVGEGHIFSLSFAYFLLLLACYYMLRPLRDALVSGLDTSEIKNLSLSVFIVMLAIVPIFGALLVRVPRRKLLPAIYGFFVINLLLFAFTFASESSASAAIHVWAARIFYVWLTVFNMFVVSLFWSFMADLWREEQARRLFGVIAAGGSLGGLLGPLFSTLLIEHIGTGGITAVAALLLAAATVCITLLGRFVQQSVNEPLQTNQQDIARPLSGNSLQGLLLLFRSPFLLAIAAIVVVGAITSMFGYTETARLVKVTFDNAEARTIFYSKLDFWTNTVALILQALLVGRLTARFGVGAALIGLSVIACVSFLALALWPVLMMLAISNVTRRSAEFGLGKPGRDMLYTVTTPQEKYAAKNIIDTSVSRGADFIGGTLYSLLSAAGATLANFGWIAAGGAACTIGLAIVVTHKYRARGGR